MNILGYDEIVDIFGDQHKAGGGGGGGGGISVHFRHFFRSRCKIGFCLVGGGGGGKFQILF